MLTRNINRRAFACGLALAAATISANRSASAHDIIPGAKQTKPIVILNATLHTVSGEVIKTGTIVLKDGKISDLGSSVAIPAEAVRIDAEGKHVYPGLIDPLSNIGLSEIDSVRATIDSRETATSIPTSAPPRPSIPTANSFQSHEPTVFSWQRALPMAGLSAVGRP